MREITVLAVDLGAESGRVMAVNFDGQSLKLEELHRFTNSSVTVNGTLHWDFLRLFGDIQTGIEAGKAKLPSSIGVDTWGVDFGLLDNQGGLISNPVHYRDGRTDGIMEEVLANITSREDIFAETGIQFMPINTIYQLYSLVRQQSPLLEIADTFLMAPDLLNYWLTGAKACELSIATTSQLYNPVSAGWSRSLMAKLGIPDHIFPEIVQPETRLGEYEGIPVIAPACHDTGCAVAAMPTETENWAYISSGTWSLVGLEVDTPVINEASLAANVTNEGGVYGTTRLLKNVTGLWILQQCRQTWANQETGYSYAELVELAKAAPPHLCYIDPDDPRFLHHGDHPTRIRAYCRETGQHAPDSVGAVVRCVLESLALKYQEALSKLFELTGQPVDVLHIGGGGTQNELLNQFTANAVGVPVVAGPIEATVIGNALIQLIALGEIGDLHQARQIVGQLSELKRYQPQDADTWAQAVERFSHL